MTTDHLHHAHDPSTSREAVEKHAESGKLSLHRQLVLAMVKRTPGKTACELWDEATGEERGELCEMQEVRRRLTDLFHAGMICQGEKRKCGVKGSTMVVWEVERKER